MYQLLFYGILVIIVLFSISCFSLGFFAMQNTKSKKMLTGFVAMFLGLSLGIYQYLGNGKYIGEIYSDKFQQHLLESRQLAPALAKLKREKFKKVYLTSIEPDNAENYFELAKLYDLEQDLASALANYQTALELEPDNIDYAYGFIIANIKQNKGNVGLRLKNLLEANLKKNKVVPEAVLAFAALTTKDKVKAQDYLNSAISAMPNHAKMDSSEALEQLLRRTLVLTLEKPV